MEAEKKLPQSFTFTKEERLELENLQLKLKILDTQVMKLMSEQKIVTENVSKRVGISTEDINKYLVNPETGEAVLKELPK